MSTTLAIQAQESPRSVDAAFYAFKYAEGLKEIYLRSGKNTYDPVKLSTANMVGTYKVLVNDGVINLYTISTNEEGVLVYPKIGSVKVSGKMSQALIILSPIRNTRTPGYQALIINRDETKFRPGTYKLINLSPYSIRGAIGKGTRFTCARGKIATFKTKGVAGESLPVLFEYNASNRWRRLTETRWSHNDDKRMLLCAFLDQSSKRMKLRSIPDNIAKKKADSK